MEMMWGVLVILLCGSLASGVSVNEISLICDDYSGEIPESDTYAPSLLVDLKATATLDQGHYLFNISWAIAVDSTLKYVKGIIILVTGNVMLKCEYDPPLKELKLPNDQEEPIWFHHSVYAFYAPQPFIVQAKNIPQQPVDHDIPYRYVTVYPPRRPDPTHGPEVPVLSTLTTPVPSVLIPTESSSAPIGGWLFICGGLALCVVLLLFGCVTYKACGARLAVEYKKMGPGAMVPLVPVLVVYPAGSTQFQRAVGALVEFLQQYGGCIVAVDMWQQGSVASLGPMRWLLEQVQAARTVLIVAPQPRSIPGASIPAAAQDLYPLALNLVAGQAKDSSKLAKFWVVRFGESAAVAPELKACQAFCLTKDLNKLCRRLHQNEGNGGVTVANVLLRGNFCSGRSAEKLAAAVQDLNERHAGKDQDAVGNFQNV
ncbi:hypothetical protein NL108_000992 [Boleophthalmus pectinirostris]|nr:hypothetical protein NL108_000992 [Boleophthalmus pectinirostris]